MFKIIFMKYWWILCYKIKYPSIISIWFECFIKSFIDLLSACELKTNIAIFSSQYSCPHKLNIINL